MSHLVFGVLTGTSEEALTAFAVGQGLPRLDVVGDGNLITVLRHIASIWLPYQVPHVIMSAEAVSRSKAYAAAVVGVISSMRGKVHWVGDAPDIDADAEQAAIEALRLQASIAPVAPSAVGAGVLPMRVGRPPFGYSRHAGELKIHEPEAALIRDVFALRAQGKIYSEILPDIKANRYPAKGPKDAIKTAHWDKTRIARILRNADAYQRGIFRTATGGKYVNPDLIIVKPAPSTP
jgi:hypothetical protein